MLNPLVCKIDADAKDDHWSSLLRSDAIDIEKVATYLEGLKIMIEVTEGKLRGRQVEGNDSIHIINII